MILPVATRAPDRETGEDAAMMSPVATRDPEADGPMTSGMVALVPSAGDAAKMAVQDGEDPAQLHVTLAYLGDNASDDMTPEHQSALHQVMGDLAASVPPIPARVAGHLLFNPDGGPDGDRTPCAAYLVSDSPDLTPLHTAVSQGVGDTLPDVTQHTPWIPHITGAYDRGADALHYAGPITLGALRVAIGGQSQDYPLTGSTDEGQDTGDDPAFRNDADNLNDDPEDSGEAETDREEKAATGAPEAGQTVAISVAELDAAYADRADLDVETKDGQPAANTMTDGSYPINHPGQLKSAVHALTAYQVDKTKRAALRKHVIHHAARLHAGNMVPDSVRDEKDDDSKDGKASAKTKATGTKDAAPGIGELETKKVVASQAGVKRYGKPIGTQLGTPRDAAAAKAQQNGDAVNAYRDLLAGKTGTVEPLGTMDTASLEDLTRVAYSYKSTDPKVVALRIHLANELARRGLKATSYGALGGGGAVKPGKRRTHTGLPAGVRAPHQEKSALDAAELEYKSTYTAEQRRDMAKKGHALPDGSYPIANKADLQSAIKLRNHGKGYAKATVHKHIVKRAKALDAASALPDDMIESKSLSWDGASDAFTAGVLLGLAGLEPAHALEIKAGPPGHTFASPDPGATKLRKYWVRGEGALKIRWGTPGDFDRCVTQMTKYVGERAKGLCNIYHRSALGVAPGQEDKVGGVAKKVAALAGKSIALPGDLEFKSAKELWISDPAGVDGWRAYAPAWEADTALIQEMKAFAPNAAPPGREDQANTDADPASDDDLMSSLDSYAAMVPQLSAEDAYEEGIAEDVPWALEAQGDLTDPTQPGSNLNRDTNPDGDIPDSDDSGLDVDGSADVATPDMDAADGDPLFDESDEKGDRAQNDDVTPDGDDGEPDTDDQIPQVAELLAALMADQDAEETGAPGDDNDAGQAQEDQAETRPRHATATA